MLPYFFKNVSGNTGIFLKHKCQVTSISAIFMKRTNFQKISEKVTMYRCFEKRIYMYCTDIGKEKNNAVIHLQYKYKCVKPVLRSHLWDKEKVAF
jgi:hypothetical protein